VKWKSYCANVSKLLFECSERIGSTGRQTVFISVISRATAGAGRCKTPAFRAFLNLALSETEIVRPRPSSVVRATRRALCIFHRSLNDHITSFAPPPPLFDRLGRWDSSVGNEQFASSGSVATANTAIPSHASSVINRAAFSAKEPATLDPGELRFCFPRRKGIAGAIDERWPRVGAFGLAAKVHNQGKQPGAQRRGNTGFHRVLCIQPWYQLSKKKLKAYEHNCIVDT
jgi:hypothetical protein